MEIEITIMHYLLRPPILYEDIIEISFDLPPTMYTNVGYLFMTPNVQKKNSLFTDIMHTGGGEVNPMSNKNYKFFF